MGVAAAITILVLLTFCIPTAGCAASSEPRKAPQTILEEWDGVEVPEPPRPEPVKLDPATTALLVLDIQRQNCNAERRPRCVSSLPAVQRLLERAREAGAVVAYSLTSSAEPDDIRAEVAPREGEPVVRSGVDKFFGTYLEDLLRRRGIETVVLVGTSAHGAVLHTATGAAARDFRVVVPVDGMSSTEPYAEQYTAWHLVNALGTRRRTTLTRTDLVEF